jgi:hypothetical protein
LRPVVFLKWCSTGIFSQYLSIKPGPPERYVNGKNPTLYKLPPPEFIKWDLRRISRRDAPMVIQVNAKVLEASPFLFSTSSLGH